MTDPSNAQENGSSCIGEILPPEEEERIRSFGEALAPLVRRYGFTGIESIGRLIGQLERLDPRAVHRLFENGPVVIDALSGHGPETVLDIFTWSHRFLPYGAFPPVLFLESAPRLLDQSDLKTVNELVRMLAEEGRICPPLLPPFFEVAADLLALGGSPPFSGDSGMLFCLGREEPLLCLEGFNGQ